MQIRFIAPQSVVADTFSRLDNSRRGGQKRWFLVLFCTDLRVVTMRLCHRGVRLQRKKRTTVATLLGPELGPIVREWLKRIQLVPELARLSLRDEERAGHLPKLFHDLICQLTFP